MPMGIGQECATLQLVSRQACFKDFDWLMSKSCGVQVYYLPHLPVYQQNSLPTLFDTFPFFRYITLREQIDIVHSHQVYFPLITECKPFFDAVVRTSAHILKKTLYCAGFFNFFS